MSRSCFRHVSVMFGHVLAFKSWSCCSHVGIMSRIGHFCIFWSRLVMSQMVFQSCPGHVIVISRSSSCNESVRVSGGVNGLSDKSLPV